MRISKSNWMVSMVMAATMVLCVSGPANVMAGGEPGAGCDLPGAKYDPAPYLGDIVLEWIETSNGIGDVYANGIVEQAGNTGCVGSFSGVIIEGIALTTFQNWKSNDLRQTCIHNESNLEGIKPFECQEDGGYLEVVGVGGLKELPGTSLEAKFVIMELK